MTCLISELNFLRKFLLQLTIKRLYIIFINSAFSLANVYMQKIQISSVRSIQDNRSNLPNKSRLSDKSTLSQQNQEQITFFEVKTLSTPVPIMVQWASIPFNCSSSSIVKQWTLKKKKTYTTRQLNDTISVAATTQVGHKYKRGEETRKKDVLSSNNYSILTKH